MSICPSAVSAVRPYLLTYALLFGLLALPATCTAASANAASTTTDAAADSSTAQTWLVGAAKVDITPNYPIRLNGFAVRKTESEGTSQPIWARALAIGSDSEGPAVLLTVDSLGVRLPLVDEVARRLAERTGLQRERLALTFTHTHCAPKVNGASDNIFAEPIPAEHQAHIDRYTAELTDALEQVAVAALQNRQPATLAWSVGKVGFAKNRRTVGGPVDHDLPVLAVRSPDGTVRAVLTTYACHCVTLSHNLISGDWAGYAQVAIERHFPDAVGLVSIGCGSDQNPSSGVTGDKTEIAEQQGLQIADEAARLIRGELRPVSGPLVTQLNRIALPFNELPTREQYQALVTAGGPAGYNAQTQLARLDRGDALPTALEYPVQTWTFGDSLCMVFLGGEVCVDYALRLKRELPAARLWLHGYSNDFGAYIPSERLLQEGGYGGGAEIPYFALPTTLKAGLEQRIVDEVLRQFPANWLTAAARSVPPRAPADALASFTTHPELRMELVAAEPQVADPVAIDFDAAGRVWVAEMLDYARGVEEEFEPSGQIRVLADADGDQRYESSTVFLGGLRYPTDVKVWRKGVLVCDAPDILYAEDTDADGRADVRRVLFTGFATLNGQARVNSLQWGLDNWVYGSCGLFGGVITNTRGEQVDVTGRDFRLQPDTGVIEPVTGRTQQSRVRDDWGNWFGCDNGTLIRHYPVYDEYARRNPFVAPPATAVYVPGGPQAGRLFPPDDLVLFKLSGAPGAATAACGVGIYRDTWLGPDYYGNSFTCEPVNQLVYRQQLTRSGATFRGQRAENEQASEFLTSTDQWFRPVQARTGPDGALWIVDMYRYVIEHPRWIPDETLATLDVFAGQGMGRIYRIVPRNTGLRPRVPLSSLPHVELAEALDTDNGVQRDLIHQRLIWEEAVAAVPVLERIARTGRSPAARVSALCVLDGLQRLIPQVLLQALRDEHPEVRRHAVRLSEKHFPDAPELTQAVLALTADPAFEVRLQLANSLGFVASADSAEALVQLASSDDDRYLLSAALSSLNTGNLVSVLDKALSTPESRNRLGDAVLVTAAGLGDSSTIQQILQTLLKKTEQWQAWQFRAVAQLLDGLDRRQPPLTDVDTAELTASARDLATAAMAELQAASTNAAQALAAMALLGRPTGPVTRRLFADTLDGSETRLSELIAPQYPATVQLAAVQAIVRRADPAGATVLLERLPSSTPVIRAEIVQSLLNQQRWLTATLDALADKRILPQDLDAVQRERLLQHPAADIRQRAEQLLAESGQGSRQQLVEQWRDVLQLTGDAAAGRQVFAKRCASCHKVQDLGFAVGPDLTALTTRTADFLLTAILDPNRDVDGRYQGYIAVNDEGRTFAGLLVSETATSLTLKEQEAKEHVLLRNRVEELRATGKSAMPEGLEKDLTREDLAHLLTWLQSLGPAPKVFPGNQPQVIAVRHDGAHVLSAATAAIFGQDIAFESDSAFRNIGYWHDRNDHVVWTVQVDKQVSFDVWLDYSCDDASAGNTLQLTAGQQSLRFPVAGTGGWSHYRFAKIGRLTLPAGRDQITISPADGFRGPALLDLRAVRLVTPGSTPAFAVAAASGAPPADPSELAARILDDNRSREEREKLIADWPQLSPELLTAMTAGLPDDEAEEYRRIPWIWRVAIAAGRRNQADELLAVVDASLPGPGEPLRDWQAVVIGGGVINGLSLTGVWPRDRLDRLIAGNNSLSVRWDRAIAQAAVMADNEQVRTGTRYDALRMLAMESWEERGAQLAKYLAAGVHDELQMGAISGLSDMPAAEAGRLLLENIGHYSDRNRELALDALLRTTPRILRLLQAVEAGQVSREQLGAARIQQLLQHADRAVQQRATELLAR